VTLETDIPVRLVDVRARVERATARAGRPPGVVRVIAVSKTFSAEHVRAAAGAGQIDFGENKVQEALQKIPETADLQIRWHLVGHLQSNKARKAVESFAWIHSIDRPDLLDRLDVAAAEAGTAPRVLVQVDLAGEPTKHGATVDAVRALVDRARTCRAVRAVGLMTLPPYTEDPHGARPFFRRLREIRERLLDDGVEPSLLGELSMGMSHDFEVAIDEGATMVRVGTAIFGSRGQ
jgi:PLP dependent protein